MTKEKIISLINNRIEELSVPYQKDDDFNFFQDFVEKNSVRQASDFLNIEIVKFLQGLFYLEINREKDKDEVIGIKECKNIINSILSFVKNLSINSLDILGIDFYYYYKDKELSKIIKYVEEKDKDKEEQILKSIYSDNEKKQSTVKDIKKIINNNSKGCFTYLKVMNDYPLEIMSVMSFFKGYRLMLQIEKKV